MKIVQMTEKQLNIEALRKAGEILQRGGLVAFPTETVYGLGGNALDPEASKKIYAAKGRPSDNPMIVHIAKIEDLLAIVSEIPEKAERLKKAYLPGPLTMIFHKSDKVPYETTGGLDSVAVRFPSNRIAKALIQQAGGYLAAPSANISGRPSPTLAVHVQEDLGDRIDMIIDGGQVDIGLESTIVDFTEDSPIVLRPGYLDRSMLEQVLGEVRIDHAILSADSRVRSKAPGMRYKHYAPQADLVVVKGLEKDIPGKIRELVHEKIDAGYKTGIICTSETKGEYPEGIICSIGCRADEESIARHLYEVLRKFDNDGVEYIYSESFYTPRIGEAIMNRLLKAAGHEIIEI